MPTLSKTTLSKSSRAEQWAGRICTQLGKSVESIIEVGRLLVKAKADLAHGEWGRLFEDELVPFSINTAQRLMAVSQHPVLSNTAHGQHLPSSWRTLYELTKVEPQTLTNALKDGVIAPDMERRAVRALMPAALPSEPHAFHWLTAIGDLRARVERVINAWPDDARRLAPKALRDLAEILERECADASGGHWRDDSDTIAGQVIPG